MPSRWKVILAPAITAGFLAAACAGRLGQAPVAPPVPGAPAATAPPPAAAAAPDLTDVMPLFWRFWDQAAGKPANVQVELLRSIVLAPHQEFYDEVIHIPDDARLRQIIETLTPAIPDLRRIAAAFPDALRRSFASFLIAYPDLDAGIPIYAVPSLFTSNGQVRYFQGRPVVMYGLDVTAVILPHVTDPAPDIQHELFHAYHWQHNPEFAAAGRQTFDSGRSTPMYLDLWQEGLALHAVRTLNPKAPLSVILASNLLPEKGPALLPRIAAELRARLDSKDLKEIGDYFFMSTRRTDFPPRIAYYVGLRLAEEVAQRTPMDRMVRLTGPELRRTIDEGLQALE